MSFPLIYILSFDKIRDHLLAALSPKQLMLLATICRTTYNMVSRYMTTAFSIDERLSRFFPDVRSFRCMQALTSTIISGSFALQFFDRSFYPGSDLDLYVHLHHRRTVGRWILKAGYTFTPFSDQDENFERAILRRNPPRTMRYSMPGVADILTFHRENRDDSKVLKVQVIVARRTPMEVILGFHSSKHLPYIGAYVFMFRVLTDVLSMRHERNQLRESLLSVPTGYRGEPSIATELVLPRTVNTTTGRLDQIQETRFQHGTVPPFF